MHYDETWILYLPSHICCQNYDTCIKARLSPETDLERKNLKTWMGIEPTTKTIIVTLYFMHSPSRHKGSLVIRISAFTTYTQELQVDMDIAHKQGVQD